MQIIHTVKAMREARPELGRLGFVPTMGALHAGHLSLVGRAHEEAERVAVSIFVNPTQFGPKEDFTKYPRTLDMDLAACEEAGVDVVFAPEVDEIYPPEEIGVRIDVPELAVDLEGAERPGHFEGVCRVVTKLFNMVQPDVAIFGQKDFQQLRIIEAMTTAMSLPIRIVRGPTIREPDGLAMSSRNRYLDPEQRRHALGLSKALVEAARLIESGEMDPAAVERAMREIILSHRMVVDYVAVRDAATLRPVDMIHTGLEPVVALVAARLGEVRLIDNILLKGKALTGLEHLQNNGSADR